MPGGYWGLSNVLITEKIDRKLISSYFNVDFREKGFSVSKGFGEFLIEEKDDLPNGQVDLNGESIYHWYLVGFWADLNDDLDSWNVELKYTEFWKIRSSDYFIFNKILFSD